jgi:hypothetical protein
MTDPVLVARLRALWDDLDYVSQKLGKSAWVPAQGATRAELEVDSLWDGLEMTLLKKIERQKQTLKKIGLDLAALAQNNPAGLTDLWGRYWRAFQESQGVLRECLDIFGTLAIRNKDLDQRILCVADKLISDCLEFSKGDRRYFLLVHGMEDTFIKTTARILRLRFPEWTIWDLPLAAHELGHVLVTEGLEADKAAAVPEDRLWEPFVKGWRDALLEVDPECKKQKDAGGTQAVDAEQWAESRVYELFADAFATYTMGPAYACSAILLRLNPNSGASCGKPSDAQRAHIILSMLEWANGIVPLTSPYGTVIQQLKGCWNDTLSRVNPAAKLTPEYEAKLKDLADAFGKDAGPNFFRGTALYPPTGDREGWARAQAWANNWLTQTRSADGNLTLPERSSENLRDVLNAAWFCRLQIVTTMPQGDIDKPIGSLKKLQEAARNLCTLIMESKVGGGPQPQTTASSAGGRP